MRMAGRGGAPAEPTSTKRGRVAVAKPYIAVDIDAINGAPLVARAGGLPDEDAALAGLNRLWLYCFRGATDQVSSMELAGLFRGAGDGERVAAALAAFGFLVPRDGGWRVKGADRYLRLKEARRKGGLAAAGNLKRGTKSAGETAGAAAGGQPESQPESQPGTSRGSVPALTPNTEHRTPVQNLSPREAAGDVGELKAGVEAAFLGATGKPLEWGPPNGPAERAFRILAARPHADVLERWRRGLAPGFPTVATLPELAQDRWWNQLALPKQQARAGPPTRGRASNADKDWDNANVKVIETEFGKEWAFD